MDERARVAVVVDSFPGTSFPVWRVDVTPVTEGGVGGRE